MLQGIFLLFCAVFHHAVVQRIVQKRSDQFVATAVHLGGDFIDPGGTLFPNIDLLTCIICSWVITRM